MDISLLENSGGKPSTSAPVRLMSLNTVAVWAMLQRGPGSSRVTCPRKR